MAVVSVHASDRRSSAKVQMNCVLFGVSVTATEYDDKGNPTYFDIDGDPRKAIRIALRSGATPVAWLDRLER